MRQMTYKQAVKYLKSQGIILMGHKEKNGYVTPILADKKLKSKLKLLKKEYGSANNAINMVLESYG